MIMKISHHLNFLLATLIVIVIVILSFLTYEHVLILNYRIGSYRFSHWLSIIGTIYIAIATPLFVILKRSFHTNWLQLTRFHIFGNLLFFALISLHFAAQMGRSATSFPELGTGLALFIAMALQVASGFTQRFRSQRASLQKLFNVQTNRFIHASLVMVFYLVIVFHVLHGFGII
jgi:hypothetical protein